MFFFYFYESLWNNCGLLICKHFIIKQSIGFAYFRFHCILTVRFSTQLLSTLLANFALPCLCSDCARDNGRIVRFAISIASLGFALPCAFTAPPPQCVQFTWCIHHFGRFLQLFAWFPPILDASGPFLFTVRTPLYNRRVRSLLQFTPHYHLT